MTSTSNGADISRVATGLTSNSKITTQMPFVQYKALHEELTNQVNAAIDSLASSSSVSPSLRNNGEYRWSCSAKLLQMLGYGNFPEQNFDVSSDHSHYKLDTFGATGSADTQLNLNLSIFRLLAYHKVCNDHYTYRQWQPYNAYLCNVDYLVPDKSGSLDISSLLPWKNNLSGKDNLTLLDMRFSNLPLDYFNGVLPTPQFGSESVVNLNMASGSTSVKGFIGGPIYSYTSSNYSQLVNAHTGSAFPDVSYVGTDHNSNLVASNHGSAGAVDYAQVNTPHTHILSGSAVISGINSSLSIAALRQATALQKYKEIQLANDSDFVSQIEAFSRLNRSPVNNILVSNQPLIFHRFQ